MKNKDKRIAFLTYYLMLAGLVGLLVSFLKLRIPGSGFWFWFTLSLQTVLFMACFYSGYLFLNKDNKRAAEWGIFIHILQIFSFTIAGWSYYFVAGFGATLSYAFADSALGFTFGISSFEWELVSSDLPTELGINLFAVLILIILVGVRKRYRKIN